MSIFRKEGTILRVGQMYRIKNKWVRRLALILLFPFLFCLNLLFAVIAATTLLLVMSLFQMNLYASFTHYWNHQEKFNGKRN